jgi:hypothetical protein
MAIGFEMVCHEMAATKVVWMELSFNIEAGKTTTIFSKEVNKLS